MAHAPLDQNAWQPWIDHVCQALGLEPAVVDVTEVHELTAAVASDFTRPMAPVSAHVWGLARGTAPHADATDLRSALVEAAQAAGR